MELLNKHKGKIGIVIVFLVIIFLYKFLFAPSEEILIGGATAQDIGTDIIALNASIDRINLDSPLFNSRPFKNLIDFSTAIQPQPIGRANPFDLIGR